MFESIGYPFHSGFDGGDSAAQKPQPSSTSAPAVTPAPAPVHAPAGGPPSAPVGAPSSAPVPGHDPAVPPPKPVDQKAMAEAANNIFKSMDGWWVSGGDQSKVLDQLRGKSPEEVAAIRKSYADHFPGHNLDDDVGKNLGKEQLKEAQASLSGNTVDAAVQALKQAKSATLFGNCDKDQVSKVLAGITDPAQRAEVAKQVGPEVLATLDGRDKQLVEAQLAGDKAKENAVKIDEAMHGGLFGGGGFLGMGVGQDKEAVNKALEAAGSKEERDKLKAAYAAQTQSSLGTSEDLGKTIDANFSGTDKTIATSLLEGDKSKASAARMKLATEGWFSTDKESIYKQLEKTDPKERQAMIDAYNKEYGQGPSGQNLDAMLKENLSGLDLDKAKQLEDKGKLDETFALKYALHGSFLSTDKEAIKQTLAGKDAAQVDALVKQYQKDYGIDLRAELHESTSGRAGFEINQMMKGAPKTPEERLARANEAYQFDRGSGSNSFSTGFMDLFSDKGKLLDMQHGRIEELAEKAKAGKLTKEDEKRVEELTGYQNMDVKTYQESKDAVANTAATAAAVVAATAVTVASGGTAAPAAVALLSAVAGGGATIATKIAIQGGGYSNEDLRTDLIMTGVSAATGGVMAGLGSATGGLTNLAKGMTSSELGQQLIVQGVSGAVNTSVSNVTSAALDPATWKGANPLGTLAMAGGKGLLTGGVTGMATAGVASAMGNGPGSGFNTWKGAASSGAGAIAGDLINPEMYQGDAGQLLNKWASSVGGATLSGAGAGYQGQLHEEYLKTQAAAHPSTAPTENPMSQGQKPIAEPEAPVPSKQPTEGTPPTASTEPSATPSAPHGEAVAPEAAAAAKVIEALPQEAATGITKALPPEEAAKMTQALPTEKAAQVSEQLPAEAAAQVHEQLPPESIHKVQSEMPAEKVVAIAEAAPAEPIQGSPSAKKSLTPEHAEQYKAIDELKPLAKTPEDKTTIQDWETEYKRMAPKDAFETAKAANSANDAATRDAEAAKKAGRAPNAELLEPQMQTAEKVSQNIPELLEAQKQARMGANPELQGQRSQFEHALAREALANPEVQAATKQMSEKVLDYIERTRDTPQAKAEALQKLGATFEKGYAGAVGTDEATMRAVLSGGGNVREQMLAIENFHRLVGADVLNDKMGIKFLQERFGTVPEGETAVYDPTQFGPAEVVQLQERLEQYTSEFQDAKKAGKLKPDAQMNVKDLWSPLEAERGPGGIHEQYAKAKAQNMDTKLPGFTSEQLGQYVDLKPGTEPIVGAGESNPLARKKITLEDAQRMGIELSPRERAQIEQEGHMEWVQGNMANMVNPDARFISQAREASMPLQAGISGTTYRFMGMADLLGANPQLARLAAVGNLASIDAHSFHEIASAAQGYAGGYDSAMPYTPASTGMDEGALRALAGRQKLTLEDLNGGQQLPEPAKEITSQ